MPKLKLTDADFDTIAHCLGIAVEVFKSDAIRCESIAERSDDAYEKDANRRLIEQFASQAQSAALLRDRIDSRE